MGFACDITIRPVRLDDAAGVTHVLNGIIASGAPVAFDAPIALEAEKRYIAEFPGCGVFNVAARPSDGVLVGLQSMEPFGGSPGVFDHVGMIGTYVEPGSRRQGVATALFAATLAHARGKGFEKVMAFVRSDNPAGLALYAAHGFRHVGTAERQARIRGGYFDQDILERLL